MPADSLSRWQSWIRGLLAVVAFAALAGPVAARAQTPAQTPAQAKGTAAPTPPADAPAQVAPKRGSSWVGAGLAFGVLNLPKLGVGVTVLGEARPRRFWPLAFSLIYWFDNESELRVNQLDLGVHPLLQLQFPPGGSRLTVSAYQASAATCPYELMLASGSLALCAGIEGGVLHVSSAGFVNEHAQTRPLFAFDGYARWHFRFASSGVGITYSLGVFVPVLRDRIGYHDRGGEFHEQFQLTPIGGRLDLALAYGF